MQFNIQGLKIPLASKGELKLVKDMNKFEDFYAIFCPFSCKIGQIKGK